MKIKYFISQPHIVQYIVHQIQNISMTIKNSNGKKKKTPTNSTKLEVQWKWECRVLQNISEQKKTIPNEVINKDILSVFDNFEIFYYFNISEISMSHIVDLLI